MKDPEYHRQYARSHYHNNKHNEEYKAKRTQYQKAYNLSPEGRTKKRNRLIQRRYGLTLDRYNTFLILQNNSCGICEKPFTDTPRIDHDHECCPGIKSCGNCVRGLLCEPCNKGISFFYDNPEWLINGAAYLHTHLRGPLTQPNPEPTSPSVYQDSSC